jgi:hypothetical protein
MRETARHGDTVHPAGPPVECQNVRDCQGFVLFNSIQFRDFDKESRAQKAFSSSAPCLLIGSK